MGPGSPPASRASAGTTIFPKNEAPTCGCKKTSPAALHCFRLVIYNGWRNSNVWSGSRVLRRASLMSNDASCDVMGQGLRNPSGVNLAMARLSQRGDNAWLALPHATWA